MVFIPLFCICTRHSADKTSFPFTHFLVNTVFLGLQQEKTKFCKHPDNMWPNITRCLKASCPVFFFPVYAFAWSKPISTYSFYISIEISILAIYLLFMKMLILNLWLTTFQMVILMFLQFYWKRWPWKFVALHVVLWKIILVGFLGHVFSLSDRAV